MFCVTTNMYVIIYTFHILLIHNQQQYYYPIIKCSNVSFRIDLDNDFIICLKTPTILFYLQTTINISISDSRFVAFSER